MTVFISRIFHVDSDEGCVGKTVGQGKKGGAYLLAVETRGGIEDQEGGWQTRRGVKKLMTRGGEGRGGKVDAVGDGMVLPGGGGHKIEKVVNEGGKQEREKNSEEGGQERVGAKGWGGLGGWGGGGVRVPGWGGACWRGGGGRGGWGRGCAGACGRGVGGWAGGVGHGRRALCGR